MSPMAFAEKDKDKDKENGNGAKPKSTYNASNKGYIIKYKDDAGKQKYLKK